MIKIMVFPHQRAVAAEVSNASGQASVDSGIVALKALRMCRVVGHAVSWIDRRTCVQY